MYPEQELAALAARKLAVQARIAVHRLECVNAAVIIARPLALVDRVWDYWRPFVPMLKAAGFPIGFMLLRRIFRHRDRSAVPARKRKGRIATLLGVLPLLLRGLRMMRAFARQSRI